MNSTIRIGLAAAAVVVIAVIGYQLLSGSNVGGPGPAETPRTTSSPASSVVPSIPAMPDGLLLPGTYSVRPQDIDAPRVSITVPAGWYGRGFGVNKDDSIEPPDGAGVMLWGGRFNVYDDPCRWSTSLPSSRTGSTVDDLVAALSAQPGRDATAATDVTVGGFSGKAIELTVPVGLAFDTVNGFIDCDEGEFRSWISADGRSFRLHQGPGQHDQLWVIDVNGTRVIIDATFYEGSSEADVAEIQAILDSVGFE